ncbi:divalent-cation tolerance protein CutA [Phytomonospora endophytica]|uniref:Periplasmic divalent cation tolerance protein n=1 Tax=Phytomonospora endophytica TaxID=714109 RepID=A0A841FG47_9ACTN|nr:divalent-cation tolerance protein CutA [Phytomonospora endophytica]MBB6032818.1 periplasmic divalent cation tolerance protein [Phytomonospora endophytica]GIG66033.1 divalent cation tolerance protein [Phytomonospora endophytica]
MNDVVGVTTTVDAEEAAARLAGEAVAARLAACAQVEGPITSVYWWAGAVEESREWRVVFKTTAAMAGELTAFIVARHSYDTPEVLVTPVAGGHGPYLEWIAAETATRGSPRDTPAD